MPCRLRVWSMRNHQGGGPGAREWAQCLADAHLICCWARGQQSEKTCGAPVGKKQFPELGLGQAAAVLHLHEFKGWGRLKARPEPDTSFLEAQPPGDFMPRPGPRLEAILPPPTSETSSPPTPLTCFRSAPWIPSPKLTGP